MKNLLLGLSLATNVALGYLVLQDYVGYDEIEDDLENLGDVARGKAEQVKGALTDDNGSKVKGDFDAGKGKLKQKASDIKDNLEK